MGILWRGFFLCFWGKGKNVERSGCVKVSYTVALKLPLPHFRFVRGGELVSIVFIVIYVFVPLLKINDMGKKYLVKLNKEVWELFRKCNTESGWGVSINQRINFWLRDCDLKNILEKSDVDRNRVSLGVKPHVFALNIYDDKIYKEFQNQCKKHNISVNKALNILIREFNNKGSVCYIYKFKA